MFSSRQFSSTRKQFVNLRQFTWFSWSFPMPINLSAWNNAGRQCETLRFQVKTIAIESTCFSASNCLIQVSCKIVHWTPSAVKLFLWWTALKLVCVYLCVYIYQGEIENNEEFKILQGKFRQEKLMSAREGPTGVHDLWMDGGGGGVCHRVFGKLSTFSYKTFPAYLLSWWIFAEN